jgi:hypothetical protein
MSKLFITLALSFCLSAQYASVDSSYRSAERKANAEVDAAFSNPFDQDGKIIAEIWGTIYIKNRPLRDSVLALKGKRITKDKFNDVKEKIETKGKYKYALKVALYPLKGDSVRIEIDPDRRSRRRSNYNNTYYSYSSYNSSDKADGDSYGISYEFDWMGELLEDNIAGDVFQIGVRGEMEHNYVRLFAGVEYMSGVGPIRFRIGSGLVKHGVFQLNYSNGEGGGQWQSSLGRLNPNLRLTPLHVIGQLSPHNAVGKMDILLKDHALRFSYTIDNVKSAFGDTLFYSEKKQMYGVRGEYTMNYLDNSRYPISGFYLNGQYQSVYMKDKTDDVPYLLGNDYATPLYQRGSYNNSVYAAAHALIKYNTNSAIHLGASAVVQKFNMSNFDHSAPLALGSIGFSEQNLQYVTAQIGLRKRFDHDAILEISYGRNLMTLKKNIEAEIEDSFLEVRLNSDAMEYKFMYIFDRKVDNPNNLVDIESLIHHKTGMIFSIGMSLGSLY